MNKKVQNFWSIFGKEYQQEFSISQNTITEKVQKSYINRLLDKIGVESVVAIKPSTILHLIDWDKKYYGLVNKETLLECNIEIQDFCDLDIKDLAGFYLIQLDSREKITNFIKENLSAENCSVLLEVSADIDKNGLEEILPDVDKIFSLCYDGDCLIIQQKVY